MVSEDSTSNLPFFGSQPLHYRWYQKTRLQVHSYKRLSCRWGSSTKICIWRWWVERMKVTVGVLYHLSRDAGHDWQRKDQPMQGQLQFPSIASVALHSQARSGLRNRWRARLRSTPIDYNRGGQRDCKCGEGKRSVPTSKEGIVCDMGNPWVVFTLSYP